MSDSIVISISVEQADEIVRQSLIESYQCNLKPNKIYLSDEEPELELDQRFLAVLDELIEYYSSFQQYEEWQKEKEKLWATL